MACASLSGPRAYSAVINKHVRDRHSTNMAAIKQLVTAMRAVDREAWSAADLTQLYTHGLPAARRLAPIAGLRPKPSPELKTADKPALGDDVLHTLIWVLKGLDDQHFTEEALTQQACKLLCALADVLSFLFAPDDSRSSSSSSSTGSGSSRRSHRGSATAFGNLLKWGNMAGETRQRGCQHPSTCTHAWA